MSPKRKPQGRQRMSLGPDGGTNTDANDACANVLDQCMKSIKLSAPAKPTDVLESVTI